MKRRIEIYVPVKPAAQHAAFVATLLNIAGGYTVTDSYGVWRGADDKLHQEEVLIYTIWADADRVNEVLAEAEEYRKAATQESVLVAYVDGNSVFLDGSGSQGLSELPREHDDPSVKPAVIYPKETQRRDVEVLWGLLSECRQHDTAERVAALERVIGVLEGRWSVEDPNCTAKIPTPSPAVSAYEEERRQRMADAQILRHQRAVERHKGKDTLVRVMDRAIKLLER